MPMSKEEKNAKARAARAAAKQATATVQDAAPVFTESLPVSSEPVQVDGSFVPDSAVQDAEDAVTDLITAQQGADGAEHKAIVRMFELLAVGVASPKEFATRYADIVAERGLKLSSLAARKSNLKKVLEFSGESADFTAKVIEDGSMGLQAIYALRAEMLKLAAPKDEVGEKAETETEDDGPKLSPMEVLLQQLANAQDAAANAGMDDVCEQLRSLFYVVKARELDNPAMM
jgi:hypothetical protein